jgi:hypothetical protein
VEAVLGLLLETKVQAEQAVVEQEIFKQMVEMPQSILVLVVVVLAQLPIQD